MSKEPSENSFAAMIRRTLQSLRQPVIATIMGLLVGAVAPFERGRVRFQRPVLGAEEWVCLAETAIPAGERVRVVAIEGSFLKVAKA